MSKNKLEKTKSIVRELLQTHVYTIKRSKFTRRTGFDPDERPDLYAIFLAGWSACFEINNDLKDDGE